MLSIRGLHKSFGEQPVLRGIDLEQEAGEMVALLGPSGSGKTTLLRALMGFESLDRGEIHLRGERIDLRPAHQRHIGFVFQNYALFPHLDVAGNIAFGLQSRRWAKERQTSRVRELLQFVDLAGFERRQIGEISGGQQQRVALARALASEPDLVLLDEPLSNLDPDLRERTRRELRDRMRQVGVTVLIVTHEQDEAFELGDRVAVLHEGRLAQLGTPTELYDRPADDFVAGFVGRCSWLEIAPEQVQSTGDGEVRVHWPTPSAGPGVEWSVHDRVGDGSRPDAPNLGARRLWLRPEHLELTSVEAPQALSGAVIRRQFAGPFSLVTIDLAGGMGEVEVSCATAPQVGDVIGVRCRSHLDRGGPLLFGAREKAGG